MIYLLLILGIILIFCGYYLHRRQIQSRKETFQEVMIQEQEENSQYIKCMATNQEILKGLLQLENKVDRVINKIENMKSQDYSTTKDEDIKEDGYALPQTYQEILGKIEALEKQNKTIEEIAISLDMGKGEVLFIKNLLKK